MKHTSIKIVIVNIKRIILVNLQITEIVLFFSKLFWQESLPKLNRTVNKCHANVSFKLGSNVIAVSHQCSEFEELSVHVQAWERQPQLTFRSDWQALYITACLGARLWCYVDARLVSLPVCHQTVCMFCVRVSVQGHPWSQRTPLTQQHNSRFIRLCQYAT